MDRNDIARLAVKHGVEYPPHAGNEMRYRRLETMVAEILAGQPTTALARPDGDGVAGD